MHNHTDTNQHANSPTSFVATLLGISTPLRHDPIDRALRGPRRFHVHEDFQGTQVFAAGLIGSED